MMQQDSISQGQLKFRTGRPDDVEALLETHGLDHFTEGGFADFSTFDLERAKREMRLQVARDDTPLIVAEIDGAPIGWISWTMMHVFTVAPIAVLWTIYVAPEHRNGSVGRQLVWAASDIARAEGACAFFATVAPTSPAAQSLCRLFQAFGFEPMGGAFTKRL